jgi:hypothetical protein
MESAGAFITDGVQGFYSRRQLFGNAIDAAAPAARLSRRADRSGAARTDQESLVASGRFRHIFESVLVHDHNPSF